MNQEASQFDGHRSFGWKLSRQLSRENGMDRRALSNFFVG